MTKNPHIGGFQEPLFVPESSWQPPSELPDLRGRDAVALDLETCDPGLAANKGAAWAWGEGHICGVAAAWRDGGAVRSLYAPTAHPDSHCFSPAQVSLWVEDLVRSGTPLVFHNAPYDLGCLRSHWGISPPERPHDTTAMAVMLDENMPSYKLDHVAQWRGVPGKDEALLREAAAAFGFTDVKSSIWRLPARYAGPYAEPDAASTLMMFESMLPDLERDGVMAAYELECDLIPMVLEMRRRGIRIDEDAAQMAMDKLISKRDAVLLTISRQLGRKVGVSDIRSPRWLEAAHDEQGISYPRTPKTRRGSFTTGKNGWMTGHPHWLPRDIALARKYEEAAEKFIQGYILDFVHNGRLHANVNQFRSEDGGTRSHRFSYSDPPLQQMPERDPEMGPLIRGLFLPEEGQVWGAHDYSQQEYRMIVHVAALLDAPKARDAADLYHNDPSTDFHSMVADWTKLERKRAKDTNFAKAFGAGAPKFASMIGADPEEAEAIYRQYDRELPFVSHASEKVNRVAERRGYIRLIDGARCHFDMWEPSRWEAGRQGLRLEAARAKWPNARLRRAMTHKAFNRYVQGSSARQTKMAMRECWREGLVPMLQMHDEIDFSHQLEEEGKRVNEIMRDVVKLEVPMKVDSEYGLTWGDAKHQWSEVQ